MPGQSKQSGLMAKYGAKINKSLEANREAPIETGGFQRLPPGILSGRALLTECGFFQYKPDTNQKRSDGKSAAGEWYFRAVGVAESPESVEVDGVEMPVAGIPTSIMEPICETRNSKGVVVTVEDHVKVVRDHMLMLAGGEVQDIDDLEAFAAQLKAQKVKFRFSTRAGKATPQYPNPRTFEEWHGSKGVLQDDEGAPSGVEDDTQPADDQPPPDDADATAAPEDGDDLAALVEQATAEGGDGGPGCDRLTELAVEKGMSEDEVRAAPSWQEVAEFIETGVPVSTGDPEPDKPADPEKGMMCKHRVLDAKGRPIVGKNKKPLIVDCEVKTVYAKNKTVDLLNYDDKKTVYKAVKWDALVWE